MTSSEDILSQNKYDLFYNKIYHVMLTKTPTLETRTHLENIKQHFNIKTFSKFKNNINMLFAQIFFKYKDKSVLLYEDKTIKSYSKIIDNFKVCLNEEINIYIEEEIKKPEYSIFDFTTEDNFIEFFEEFLELLICDEQEYNVEFIGFFYIAKNNSSIENLLFKVISKNMDNSRYSREINNLLLLIFTYYNKNEYVIIRIMNKLLEYMGSGVNNSIMEKNKYFEYIENSIYSDDFKEKHILVEKILKLLFLFNLDYTTDDTFIMNYYNYKCIVLLMKNYFCDLFEIDNDCFIFQHIIHLIINNNDDNKLYRCNIYITDLIIYFLDLDKPEPYNNFYLNEEILIYLLKNYAEINNITKIINIKDRRSALFNNILHNNKNKYYSMCVYANNIKHIIEFIKIYVNNSITLSEDSNLLIFILNTIFKNIIHHNEEYLKHLIENYSNEFIDIFYIINKKFYINKENIALIDTIYNEYFYYFLLVSLYNNCDFIQKKFKYFLFNDYIKRKYFIYNDEAAETFLTSDNITLNISEVKNNMLLQFYLDNKKYFTDETNKTFVILCIKAGIIDIFSNIMIKPDKNLYSACDHYKNPKLFQYIYNIYIDKFNIINSEKINLITKSYCNNYGTNNIGLFANFCYFFGFSNSIEYKLDITEVLNTMIKSNTAPDGFIFIIHTVYKKDGYNIKYIINSELFTFDTTKINVATRDFFITKKYLLNKNYNVNLINMVNEALNIHSIYLYKKKETRPFFMLDLLENINFYISSYTTKEIKELIKRYDTYIKFFWSYSDKVKNDTKNNKIFKLNTFPFNKIKTKWIIENRPIYIYFEDKKKKEPCYSLAMTSNIDVIVKYMEM